MFTIDELHKMSREEQRKALYPILAEYLSNYYTNNGETDVTGSEWDRLWLYRMHVTAEIVNTINKMGFPLRYHPCEFTAEQLSTLCYYIDVIWDACQEMSEFEGGPQTPIAWMVYYHQQILGI